MAMSDDAQLGCYRLLIERGGNFVTEISAVPEKSIDSLQLTVNDKQMIKAAIRVFNREIQDLHKKLEAELATILCTK